MTKAEIPARTAVVTGASAGLGLAIAHEFARHGYDLGLIARGEQRLQAAEAEIRAMGRKAVAVSADVSRADEVEAAAERIERELGPIDVWINNASVTVFAPVSQMTATDFGRVTQVTYLGQVHGTLTALRRMTVRDRGTIVHVGSALAYRAIPLQSAYCGAKHAVRAFVDALRVELAHAGSGVRVTMVQLPSLNTPQFSWSKSYSDEQPQPVPPIFQPEVGARAVYFAAHHRRRETWVGGPATAVIIMSRFLPGFMDRYLEVTSFDAQYCDVPLPPDHRDNLHEPAPQRYGARGIFNGRAKRHSTQFLLERVPLLHGPANFVIALLESVKLLPGFIKKALS
jgi:short-subunit dehydrogenase